MGAVIILWCSIFLIFYSYLFYPVLLKLLSRNRLMNEDIFGIEELPGISIILSVHNEQSVIAQRIRNLYLTNYPLSKIEVIVGSDDSYDDTNSILERLQNEFSSLCFLKFDKRQGKTSTINKLIPYAKNDILVFTDAKVSFNPTTIYHLVKHLKNGKIGCVGGTVISEQKSKRGITHQEKLFLTNEIKMKYHEGVIWGTSMGVYGACYAVRKELIVLIPDDFSVEDFFNTLKVLESKRKVIFEQNAVCFQNIPINMEDEFRRKVRISVGNFQNLNYFKHLLFKPGAIAFCFFSHKVVRWFCPILIVSSLISNAFILSSSPFYYITFLLQVFLLSLPIIDFFMHNIRWDIIILRFISHFYAMNLALLIGLVKFLKGVKTNVWEPTKR